MRTTLRVAAIAYITWLVIALLIITPLLNILPHRFIENNYGRELQTKWVILNPFKLSLDVAEMQLNDPDGERFASLSEASVNLSMESIWQPGWVIDTLKVSDLYANVVRKPEGDFNFSDMTVSEAEPDEEESEEIRIPGLTVHEFSIHSDAIVYTDQTRESPYSSRWNGLKIHVLDLSTVLEEGRPYSLDVYGEAGGSLHWEGTVSIPNAHSEGRLSLKNLSLPILWHLAEPWLEFEIKDGRYDMKGLYEVNWKDEVSYRITEGKIGLSTVNIAPKSPKELPETSVQLDSLDIENIMLDGSAEKVGIKTITVDGLAVSGWQEGQRFSLQELFLGIQPADPGAAPPEEEDSTEVGWSVALNKAQLINSSMRWRSEFTDPPTLDIQPIEASIENVTWPLSGDSRLALGMAVNQQAKISLDGVLALAQGDGSINYSLDGLPLTWFNPNLPEALKAQFTGGNIQIAGNVVLGEFTPTQIGLDGAIRNFSATREGAEDILTSWETVRLEGLAVDMTQNNLLLKKLAIDDYKGRLHIARDGSINAMNIWKEEVGEQAEEIAADLSRNKPWAFSIPAVELTDSEIDFMDQSLPIVFRTVVGDLNGEILGMATNPATAATIELKGSVDGYAPVALGGEFNPFDATADLDLTFDGVDMALLSPYSGTYAGYPIEQGLLNLHLHYALQSNKLQGKNDFVIDQLKLGKKIKSDKAVDVPLELALGILTDSNGVIDMKVPVSGNIDDPEFSLGGVISKAFINILTKAVTAPFSLLAGLVDSDEDLQRLTFATGSTELDEANRAKLDQLNEALSQRPGLSLVISGSLNLSADRKRLQKNTVNAQLIEAGLSQQELDSKGMAWEKAIARRYNAMGEKLTANSEATAREQYLHIANSIKISDQQMIELSEQRAIAVKNYLINVADMEVGRAALGKSDLDEKGNLFSGVVLGIDN